MVRAKKVALLGLAVVGAAAVVVAIRHGRGATGRHVPGGIVIGDAALYDALSHRLLLGSLFARVADDVARTTPAGGRVLEVGCGPGRLSLALTQRDLHVSGLDLDPAMIARATLNTARSEPPGDVRPTFLVGDVGALPFPDGSFDVVVSTLSMHHWDDRKAGLEEIGRVLRPDGRALVWDLRPGAVPLHRDVPDPLGVEMPTTIRLVDVAPWQWPLRLRVMHRMELARAA
jgi:ubiquinone/menaquinone biosynthesis C-methylase UbiE